MEEKAYEDTEEKVSHATGTGTPNQEQDVVRSGCMCCDDDDDGLPDLCRNPACPLDPRNRWLGNRNPLCLIFGNVGWQFFDRNRKRTMSIAMTVTILAIIITTYGCFALSPIDNIVRVTYWEKIVADISVLSNDSGEDRHTVYVKLLLGLSTLVVVECETRDEAERLGSKLCDWEHRARIYWSSKNCLEPRMSLREAMQNGASTQDIAHLILCGEDSDMRECAEMLADPFAIQLGAFMSCATLVFALMGTINRYRKKSDVPQQKLLGCLTDSWGALSLLLAVLSFDSACYLRGDIKIHDEIDLSYHRGPGVICYIVCITAGFIRAICHWLTPLPGLGVGACTFRLPHILSGAFLHSLDFNGDGRVDIHDLMILLDSHHAGIILHPHEMASLTSHLAHSVSHGAGGMLHAAGHAIHDMEHNAAELAKVRLKGLLSRIDKNGDGTLDLKHLLSFGAGLKANIRRRMDLNNDGKLDCDDIKICCGCASAKVAERDEDSVIVEPGIPCVSSPRVLPRSPLAAKLPPLRTVIVREANSQLWSPTEPAKARQPLASIVIAPMPPALELGMSRRAAVEVARSLGKKKKEKKKDQKGNKRRSEVRPLQFGGSDLHRTRCATNTTTTVTAPPAPS